MIYAVTVLSTLVLHFFQSKITRTQAFFFAIKFPLTSLLQKQNFSRKRAIKMGRNNLNGAIDEVGYELQWQKLSTKNNENLDFLKV